MNTALPQPSPEARDHSERLRRFIRDQIVAQGGWISFAEYMRHALYRPGLGYYSAGPHKLGEAGDFVTAPELSTLFGRTLAKQVAEVLSRSAPHVLELGAGSGKLAVDILGELNRLGTLPDSYSILEVSPDLRARQQALIIEHVPLLADRVRWLDTLPETFSGAVIANEVMDALPVHLLHWRDSAITERGVAVSNDDFIWQEREIHDTALLSAAQNVMAADDTISELCLAARGLITSLAQTLNQGAMLFIDYGFGAREYFHPQRRGGTLMCHYRHYAHDDPFYLPGLQDITAHVNFTDIAECGIDAGLELLGYTSQAFFLINCGITELMNEVSPDNLRDYLPLSSQLQKLTSPAEMGDLFKVIALGRNISEPLCGFARGDMSRML
jgi:SAM-dependent MidA family methyltransferase